MPSIRPTPGDPAWFVRDRFGLFIHWGLYALPARHEWVRTREKMSDAHYDRYFRHFDPDLYDPQAWARQAKAAGMKYAVLTAKHHEGFCLWDTEETAYKAANTPAGRDLVREFVDAFRAEGLRVGFYYSLLDWHHPDFTIDMLPPRSEDPDAEALNEGRDLKRYAAFMRAQVRELLTNYGKIDLMWFDFSYPDQAGTGSKAWMRGKGKEDWEAEELLALVRELQPEILINNRTGIEQDFVTPEQYQPTEWPLHEETGERLVWEACQTFSGSWGYHRDEQTWKSPKQLIDMLIKTVSLGGNLLLNAGPTARGYLDHRAEHALSEIAAWMHLHARSIHGCTAADGFRTPADCRLTRNGDRLYIHLLNYPFGELLVDDLSAHIEYAQFLHDGSEVRYKTADDNPVQSNMESGIRQGAVRFELPAVKPDTAVPVIEITLRT